MKKPLIDNIVIDTDSAASKIFGKDKKIGNVYSTSDIYSIDKDFQRLSTGIQVASHFAKMFKETSIRRIDLEINGSGDDGGIDRVELFNLIDLGDENYEKVKNYYCTGTMKLEEVWNGDGKYQWKMESSNYNDQNELKVFEKSMGPAHEMCPEEFFSSFILGYSKYQKDSSYASGNFWTIKTIKTDTKSVEMYRICTDEQHCRNFPYDASGDSYYYKDTQTNHMLLLDHPEISIQDWSAIEDHAYTQLHGGWEINEGSSNTVVYTIKRDILSEEGYYVQCEVEQNQYVMETDTSNKKYVFKSDTSDKLRTFIKEELKMTSWQGKTLDFSLKADRTKIERLHKFINMINDSNDEMLLESSE